MKKSTAALVGFPCCLVAASLFAKSIVVSNPTSLALEEQATFSERNLQDDPIANDSTQDRPSAANQARENQSPAVQAPDDPPTGAELSKTPQISDEPRTIDPRAFLPEILGVNASVNFQTRSLEELVDWLRERGLNVVVQQAELANKGVMLADPISDWIEDAPIYFLLDRLSLLNIGWYVQDDIICITHQDLVASRLITRPYHLGELLDEQFEASDLMDLIQETIDPNSWEIEEGQGRINQVGDMIFVRTSERNQRNVQALLQGLREHGRQTLIAVPQANVLIREQLSKRISVRFRDTPLTEALQILSKDAGVDIRLDRKSIRATRVRESQPVTLQVENVSLDSVLNFMLKEIGLTWMIRDGVLWATAESAAENNSVTAVYDVRDLSVNNEESWALSNALQEQMPDGFEDQENAIRFEFAKPGILVVWGLESDQAEILKLLESYRVALRSSKARKPAAPAEDEAITLYYRLHANVAVDLKEALPELVQPDSWKSRSPDSVGTIRMLESRPEMPTAKSEVPAAALLMERRVLVIHQRKSVHKQISELIQKIENGDVSPAGMGMGGGGMGGMGGGGSFGSGFF